METVQFRGAILRRFESPPAGETTPFVRSHWTVDFAEPSNQTMGWKDPGECGVTGADLVGDIAAANVVVTPHDPSLTKHEIQFDAHEASDFKLHTVKEEESTRREVRFIIRSNVRGVAAMLEEYRWSVGDKQAILKLSYVKQEPLDLGDTRNDGVVTPATEVIDDIEKQKIDLEVFGPDDGPCVSCNNRLGWEDDAHSIHMNGSRCARVAGSSLSSAAVVVGTHQKRGRGRPKLSDDLPQAEDDGITQVN